MHKTISFSSKNYVQIIDHIFLNTDYSYESESSLFSFTCLMKHLKIASSELIFNKLDGICKTLTFHQKIIWRELTMFFKYRLFTQIRKVFIFIDTLKAISES